MAKKFEKSQDIELAIAFLAEIDKEAPSRIAKMRKFSSDIADEIIIQLYGELYQRTGLDLKTRIMLSVVVAASNDLIPQLTYQLRLALLIGWKASEIREALLQVGLFVGLSRSINAEAILAQVEHELN